MRTDDHSQQAERMPLWLVFVPISPIFAMLYSMRRWREMKLGWINRHSSRAAFNLVTVTTILSFIFCTPLLWVAEKSGSVLLQFIALHLCCIFASAIIREIDYRTRKKTIEKLSSKE